MVNVGESVSVSEIINIIETIETSTFKEIEGIEFSEDGQHIKAIFFYKKESDEDYEDYDSLSDINNEYAK